MQLLSRKILREKIFDVTGDNFDQLALDIFRYQHQNNGDYREYCDHLRIDGAQINAIQQIPFLPITFFKTRRIVTGTEAVQQVFSSSGTTGLQTSRHFICDPGLYEESFLRCFQSFFGPPEQYCIVALLPSYLERSDSSLVYMTGKLIERSGHPDSGFFLHDFQKLFEHLEVLEKQHQPVLFFGVTFALLDFAAQFPLPLKHTRIIETGGMKGKRAEITRKALHRQLQQAFGSGKIYSEYGMTELLSQAYLLEDEKFHAPHWMKILIRDVNDPLQIIAAGNTGAINIIDLANIDSCAFIATSDLGKLDADGSFETLGRMDYSDVRGCNLMWQG